MDKFGIFNLIGSLQDFYKTHGKNFFGTSESQNATESPPKSNQETPTKSTPANTTNTTLPPKPLQQSMLNTINSHDQFIRRVKTNAFKKD